MHEAPESRTEAPGIPPSIEPKPLSENAFFKVARRPRIMLILLGFWNILGAVGEFFLDVGGKIEGPLGGMAASWQAIPLAVLYLYCARDPVRYHRIFWLALIQMIAAIAANFYHWGAGDVAPESIVLPLAGSGTLGLLVFLHLFDPRPMTTHTSDYDSPI